jgi:hypothetical protein
MTNKLVEKSNLIKILSKTSLEKHGIFTIQNTKTKSRLIKN